MTVWIKGNGGNNAISMFSNFKSFVKDTTSVAKKCAELRSVFIFQFPATRGFLKTEEALQTPLPAEPHSALSKALTTTERATRTHTESKDILLANAKQMRIEQQLRHVFTKIIPYVRHYKPKKIHRKAKEGLLYVYDFYLKQSARTKQTINAVKRYSHSCASRN